MMSPDSQDTLAYGVSLRHPCGRATSRKIHIHDMSLESIYAKKKTPPPPYCAGMIPPTHENITVGP